MSDVTGAAPRDVTRDPRAWLEAHTRAVTHVARRVAQSRGLPADASQALESAVRARLAEDDYEVLRRYRGEADIRTYLVVVASRLLLDQRPEA
jgi:DNA-directed RNA polymerase specialized sigma24 family protein